MGTCWEEKALFRKPAVRSPRLELWVFLRTALLLRQVGGLGIGCVRAGDAKVVPASTAMLETVASSSLSPPKSGNPQCS